jgi:hypothetical protein
MIAADGRLALKRPTGRLESSMVDSVCLSCHLGLTLSIGRLELLQPAAVRKSFASSTTTPRADYV